MGTSFEELYDIFMTATITDYKLNELFVNNLEAFVEYLRTFIVKSSWEISEDIITPLDFEDIEVNIGTDIDPIMVNRTYFTNILKPKEKLIIVNFMAVYWYEKHSDDIIAITSRLSGKAEREMNTQSNLKTKLQRINELRSEAYATIRSLQNDNLEELGWGDW